MKKKVSSFSLSPDNIEYVNDQWEAKGKRNRSHWLDDLLTHLREKSGSQLPAVAKPKAKRFKPPTFEEVGRYMCDEKGLPPELAAEEAAKFIDHHTSKGWLIGNSKTKMKNWKAAVNTWLRGMKGPTQKQSMVSELEEKISNFNFNDEA